MSTHAERRLRERNLRELGIAKVSILTSINEIENYITLNLVLQPRDQLPFELLRESRNSGIDFYTSRRERISTATPRQTPLHEDGSRFSRFVGKAKNLASKGKDSIVAKYHTVRAGKQEDVVELLPANSSSEELVQSANSRGSGQSSLGIDVVSRNSREPPKDLFDDI